MTCELEIDTDPAARVPNTVTTQLTPDSVDDAAVMVDAPIIPPAPTLYDEPDVNVVDEMLMDELVMAPAT